MFNSLSGTITGKYPQKLFLDTHGIEWDITMPDTSLDSLPPLGEQARVFTYMQHTDAAMTLFGFASERDRALFFDLLKVDGVGPKSAVKIMSSIALSQLVAALDEGNLAALEKVPGLGKKTAQKMLLQLKGKLTIDDESPRGAKTAPAGVSSEYADVISALSDMGYDKRDVESVISRLVEELSAAEPKPGEKAFKDMVPSAKEEVLFRRAIVELA
ncbi:MAG: Holliday junction branch migration protein RuvA [Treponema sp.]|nr:Holliday junction branch migration protein RuvA [Treponema sp.]